MCLGAIPRAVPAPHPAIASAATVKHSSQFAPEAADPGQVPPASPMPCPAPNIPGPAPPTQAPPHPSQAPPVTAAASAGSGQPSARSLKERAVQRALGLAQPWTGRWPENSGTRSELRGAPQAPRTPEFGAGWVGDGHPQHHRSSFPSWPVGSGQAGTLRVLGYLQGPPGKMKAELLDSRCRRR